jgi:hypothetical protein
MASGFWDALSMPRIYGFRVLGCLINASHIWLPGFGMPYQCLAYMASGFWDALLMPRIYSFRVLGCLINASHIWLPGLMKVLCDPYHITSRVLQTRYLPQSSKTITKHCENTLWNVFR